MTPDEVELLIRDLFGVEPVRIERMGYGHCNVVYDVALPEVGAIVRTNRRDPSVMAGTERNLRRLAELGLPVPRILAADLTLARYDAAYMVMERLPGRDLGFELGSMSRAQMTRLAEQVVDFQRRVAVLPRGRRFGWAPIDEPARFESWPALLERDLTRNLTAAGPLAPEGAEGRLRGLLEVRADELAAVEPLPFLDDLTTKNVLIEGGELCGVVDFDWIGYGDSRYWLGLTQTAVASDSTPEGAFYVEELFRLRGVTPSDRGTVALYSAMFVLDFLGWWRTRAPDEKLQRLLGLFERFASEASDEA